VKTKSVTFNIYVYFEKCTFEIEDRSTASKPEFYLPKTLNPMNNKQVVFEVTIPKLIQSIIEYSQDSHLIRSKKSVHNSGLPDGNYIIVVSGVCV